MTDIELENARKLYREEMERQKEILEILKSEPVVKLRETGVLVVNEKKILNDDAILELAFKNTKETINSNSIMVYVSNIEKQNEDRYFKSLETNWENESCINLTNRNIYRLYRDLETDKLEIVSCFDYARFKKNYLIINIPNYITIKDFCVKIIRLECKSK